MKPPIEFVKEHGSSCSKRMRNYRHHRRKTLRALRLALKETEHLLL